MSGSTLLTQLSSDSSTKKSSYGSAKGGDIFSLVKVRMRGDIVEEGALLIAAL